MTFQLQIAGRTLYQEARGEPLIGQKAVAHVFVNSMKDGRWGTNLASACLWHARFSGWFSPRHVDGKPFRDPNFAVACALGDDDPALVALIALIQAALDGEEDCTGGALFYYAASMTPAPTWAAGMTLCGRFGNQIFLTDKKQAQSGALTS